MNKSSAILRACAALACAFGLAACGGGDGSVSLGGTVSGLTTEGLILTNGYITTTIKAGATSFKFPTELPGNYLYSVSVVTQPTDLTCTIANGEGYSGSDDITNVAVTCTQTAFKLGGTVSGLRNSGLVLANGATTVEVPAGATAFQFGAKVQATRSYGVTILFQPAGQTCSIANGVGVQPSADNNTVAVACI
jgi:hypothetical protein